MKIVMTFEKSKNLKFLATIIWPNYWSKFSADFSQKKKPKNSSETNSRGVLHSLKCLFDIGRKNPFGVLPV